MAYFPPFQSLPTVLSQDTSSSHLTPVTDLSRPGYKHGDHTQTSPEEYGFTLSSNPPNPRNTFRQGDWM